MGFEPPVFDRSAAPPPAAPPPADRREQTRRRADHSELTRTVVATLIAVCGGLAAIYLFFAAMGAVDVGDAVAATVIAVIMGLVWFVAFYYRQRNNAGRVQWRDRERRGF